ncbi:MAG: sugar phosphate isomerase/epimerase family protein [Candidatus Brocadiia bacterium]
MGHLQYAVHAYAWTGRWSNETLDLVNRAKELGFDIIEIPLMELETVDPEAVRRRLDAVDMGVVTSTAVDEAHDPTAEDERTRRAAVEYLKACAKATAQMGAGVFTGVTYSALGRRISGMPDERHWDRAAAALKETAQYAQDLGVTIGIEPVNRYETFLINTGEQALRLADMVGEPNVKVHLDAYHMNIEEEDFYEATLAAVPRLCHYHLSESHRGTVGTGLVDWDAVMRALADGGYSGVVGMESFIQVSPAMAGATCIWRRLAEDTDQSLSEGLAYLRALEAQHYA